MADRKKKIRHRRNWIVGSQPLIFSFCLSKSFQLKKCGTEICVYSRAFRSGSGQTLENCHGVLISFCLQQSGSEASRKVDARRFDIQSPSTIVERLIRRRNTIRRTKLSKYESVVRLLNECFFQCFGGSFIRERNLLR